MLTFLVAIIFVSIVDCHSILRTPQSWNRRESKNNPCGGATVAQARAAPTPTTYGGTVNGVWEVTAGDGNGPITIVYVETDEETTRNGFAAAETANQLLAVTMNPIPQRGTGTYQFTFLAPPLGADCRGGPEKNACHIRVKSTSNWYSCASLALPAAPTPAPSVGIPPAPTRSPTQPPPPTASSCEILSGNAITGSMCAGLNNAQVKPSRQSVADRVQAAGEEFAQLVTAGIVFRDSKNNNLCQQYLAQLLCGVRFENCDPLNPGQPKTVCRSRCINTMYECDVDPLHETALLQNVCVSGPLFTELVADGYGSCPAALTQRRIHLKSLQVGTAALGYWTKGRNYPSQRIYKGDKLVFKYTAPATLYKFPTVNAFSDCDFSNSVKMSGTSDPSVEGGLTTYTLDTSDPMYSAGQTLYFGSKDGCVSNANMQGSGASTKVVVNIVSIPEASEIVNAGVDAAPEERPENPPTLSPPGFLGNPIGEDENGSLEKYSSCFFAIVCSFYLILH